MTKHYDTCGTCDYFHANGFRTGDGATKDCCSYGKDKCDLRACYNHCNPEVVTQRTPACEHYTAWELDEETSNRMWDEVNAVAEEDVKRALP